MLVNSVEFENAAVFPFTSAVALEFIGSDGFSLDPTMEYRSSQQHGGCASLIVWLDKNYILIYMP